MINVLGSRTGHTFWVFSTPEQGGKLETPMVHTPLIKVESPRGSLLSGCFEINTMLSKKPSCKSHLVIEAKYNM